MKPKAYDTLLHRLSILEGRMMALASRYPGGSERVKEIDREQRDIIIQLYKLFFQYEKHLDNETRERLAVMFPPPETS